ETLKYLYMLFSKKGDIGRCWFCLVLLCLTIECPDLLELNLDEYVFTTEGHLLPLSLSHLNNTFHQSNFKKSASKSVDSNDYNCPSTRESSKSQRHFDRLSYYQTLRSNVKEIATAQGSAFQ